MTTIYLARHGEYQNPDQVVPFRLEGFPLSKNGIKQSKKIAKYLENKDIKAIYTSPITRCQETANTIGYRLKIDPVNNNNLIETKSTFQGMSIEEFKGQYDVYNHPESINNGGESLEELFHRMHKVVNQVQEKHVGENVLLVTHGDPCMSLISKLGFKKLSPEFTHSLTYIPKGGLVKFSFNGKKLISFKPLNYTINQAD